MLVTEVHGQRVPNVTGERIKLISRCRQKWKHDEEPARIEMRKDCKYKSCEWEREWERMREWWPAGTRRRRLHINKTVAWFSLIAIRAYCAQITLAAVVRWIGDTQSDNFGHKLSSDSIVWGSNVRRFYSSLIGHPLLRLPFGASSTALPLEFAARVRWMLTRGSLDSHRMLTEDLLSTHWMLTRCSLDARGSSLSLSKTSQALVKHSEIHLGIQFIELNASHVVKLGGFKNRVKRRLQRERF